jgi:micrococcal nuclease
MWNYRAHLYRVVDGDTYDVAVDLGFNIYHKIRLRLKGVDTPETFGARACEEGRAATEFVKNLIEDKDVIITTFKALPTTFNRFEAEVQFTDENGELKQLGDVIVDNGHGIRVEVK